MDKREIYGFTLLELLIAISLLVILISIAVPTYMKYINNERLNNYAIPVARKCLMDLATYCAENPTGTDLQVNTSFGPSCTHIVTTSAGQVTLDTTKVVSCSTEGFLVSAANKRVEAIFNGKRVACEMLNESEIRCFILP